MAKVFCIALLVLLAAPIGRAADSLKVGDVAPDFTLPAATKDTLLPTGITLSQVFPGGNVIIAFYPADWSGGCTKEMCTMRDNFADLSGLGARVLAISGDYIYSHREWAKYHNLQFPLLSDHHHDVARLYGSYNKDSGFNRRTIYVVDRRGRIAYIDMAYIAGSSESFQRLKAALAGVR